MFFDSMLPFLDRLNKLHKRKGRNEIVKCSDVFIYALYSTFAVNSRNLSTRNTLTAGKVELTCVTFLYGISKSFNILHWHGL